mgnify:CR=1 FL=1|jgi:hypothetical protein|tara:strand:- start:156 stop:422 length:267 start_codon:yes stop_codon:yes gene_type:complete
MSTHVLTLQQRIKVATAIKAGMELTPHEIIALNAALIELRRRTIEDSDDTTYLYERKILNQKHKKQRMALAITLAAFSAINGAIFWLM